MSNIDSNIENTENVVEKDVTKNVRLKCQKDIDGKIK